MGASTFTATGTGATAQLAFVDLVRQARHEYGNGGYTGTIAEKNSFVMIPLPEGAVPGMFVNALFDARDERINDKWGPAGCVQTGPGEFLFFGWASD